MILQPQDTSLPLEKTCIPYQKIHDEGKPNSTYIIILAFTNNIQLKYCGDLYVYTCGSNACTYKTVTLHIIFPLTDESLPSQLVDPKEQMSDNLRQTVHSHHNYTPLCMAEVLGELLCIQISRNEKSGYIFFLEL